MEDAFWAERWRQGQIGFHEGRPNAFLERHNAILGDRRRVLVPLCGKAEDLMFLASRGHEVVGVELVEDAVVAFFQEHRLEPTIIRSGAFSTYSAGSITVLVGDFLALTREDVGPVNALYDRAAIVALPPELRGMYADRVRALLGTGARGLIITLEYPQELQPGPPFSVPVAELCAHYAGCELVQLEEAAWGSRSRPELRGTERCFAIRF